MQNTPVALIVTDAGSRIVYANLAARRLFDEGRDLIGRPLAAVLAAVPDALRAAVDGGADTLFSVDLEGDEETCHVSQRPSHLRGREHRLYLFRRMTRELARQEVATWKRLIRLISHELNNSLAPISSLAHSGAELARRDDGRSVSRVFATIAERAGHLNRFISGYADFAKLPMPRSEPVAWNGFLERLAHALPLPSRRAHTRRHRSLRLGTARASSHQPNQKTRTSPAVRAARSRSVSGAPGPSGTSRSPTAGPG